MKKKTIKELTLTLFSAIIIALLINKFIIFQSYIPSDSMFPTLKVGDKVIVRVVYNTDKLHRGDIVVFYNRERNETMIKRLIGLPNDIINISKGKVSVNGEYLTDISDEAGINMVEDMRYIVPNDSFFFLGDNRNNSLDSRYWENPYIHEDDIVGKALIKYSSIRDIKLLK